MSPRVAQLPPKAVPVARTRALANWFGLTFRWGIAGSALLWIALPPLDLWPLAWFAPIPWLLLVRRRELPGVRAYRQLWLAGFFFWLAAVYWLTLPYWATGLLLIALAAYLAFYLPLFVGLTRIAVHRFRVPLVIAAPVVWTGLELARAHVMSGFLMAALSHTQFRWIGLIQISDLAGGYAVSFLLMWVAACLARMAPCDERPVASWPAIPAVALLAAALAYGYWRTSSGAGEAGPHVALIQGSIDSHMKHDPKHAPRIYKHYKDLTERALAARNRPDLVVWPETMFPWTWYTADEDGMVPPGSPYTARELSAASPLMLRETVGQFDVPMLLGASVWHLTEARIDRYNSVLLVDAGGDVRDRYDKMHRVVFGEYVPLGDWLPWLYRLSPLGRGLEAGKGPAAFEVKGVRYCPSVCYENTVPHLVRSHVAQLKAAGREPDILVNLTNDGWFWGSAELDMHLACAAFRAVECRKPMLIAANTGFSAWIDSEGRVVQRGPRRATGIIHARPVIDRRESLYVRLGDWPSGVCLAACVALAAGGFWTRRRPA